MRRSMSLQSACLAGWEGSARGAPVGDVQVRLGVAVLLGQAKVDDVHLIGPLAKAHQEIVWLDVAVNEAFRVNVLYPRDLRARATCWGQESMLGHLRASPQQCPLSRIRQQARREAESMVTGENSLTSRLHAAQVARGAAEWKECVMGESCQAAQRGR